MNIDEKLKQAVSLKEAGNELYKKGDYRKAARKYHYAVLYLKGIDNDLHGTPAFLQAASVDPNSAKKISPKLESECIQVNVTVYNNLAACLLQSHSADLEKIKHYAEVVIELDNKNEKAWYRKGQAEQKLRDFHAARKSYLKVKEFSSRKDDKNLAKLLQECKVEIDRSKKKEKDMFKQMFA